MKKVVEAVKKRISGNPRRSRNSPVLDPPQSRQVSGSSSMLRVAISKFVHIVLIGIHFHVYPEILKLDMSYRFLKEQFFSMGKSLWRTL